MQKYAKMILNRVDHIIFENKEGYQEVPNNVFGGMIKQEDGIFSYPQKTAEEIEQEQKATFRQNRATILSSIDWMNARIVRENNLISQNIIPPAVPTWDTEQCNQYYIYSQALADRPALITDWSSISYPTVPAHIYADMNESIKVLCEELKCDPI